MKSSSNIDRIRRLLTGRARPLTAEGSDVYDKIFYRPAGAFDRVFGCKPSQYWDNVMRDREGVTEVYEKDGSGHRLSPINGKLSGNEHFAVVWLCDVKL